jgi:hypothetical protein
MSQLQADQRDHRVGVSGWPGAPESRNVSLIASERARGAICAEDRWTQVRAFAQETGIFLYLRRDRFCYGPYSAATLEEMRRLLTRLEVIDP